MKHIDISEFLSGATLVAIGLFIALLASSRYEISESARMGSRFFPAALGWIVGMLGAIAIVIPFHQAKQVLMLPLFALRSFLAVVIAVAAFSSSSSGSA
ncbi:MAG: hypothetical protein ABJA84_11450 [Polaromonas sp.]